jgi:hypothetical protein
MSDFDCYTGAFCGGASNSSPCAISFEDTQNQGFPVLAGNTIDYNQYYDSDGGSLRAFTASDLDSGTAGCDDADNPLISDTVVATFTQWQQDNVTPDANSKWDINPQLNLTSGDCTEYTNLIAGDNLSATFTQLLAHGATWTVGSMPALETVSTWKAGAYSTTNCPAPTTGFYFDGVTITGGMTIN